MVCFRHVCSGCFRRVLVVEVQCAMQKKFFLFSYAYFPSISFRFKRDPINKHVKVPRQNHNLIEVHPQYPLFLSLFTLDTTPLYPFQVVSVGVCSRCQVTLSDTFFITCVFVCACDLDTAEVLLSTYFSKCKKLVTRLFFLLECV